MEYPSNPEKVDPVDGRPGRNRLGACRSIRLLRPATSSLLLNTNHSHPFPVIFEIIFSIRPILDTSLEAITAIYAIPCFFLSAGDGGGRVVPKKADSEKQNKIDKFCFRESFGRVLSCYWQSYVMNSAKQGRKRPAVDGFVR
jgi:hypothetical protein